MTTMSYMPDILLELSKAAKSAWMLEFFASQFDSRTRNDCKDLIDAERDKLAAALYQAKEYIVAIAEEYEVEIA